MTTVIDKLQTNIMKILTRNSGQYLSQFEIYNNLLDDLELKDPVEKENLKIRFLMILRQLSYFFDDVKVVNKNDVLYVAFSPEKDTSVEEVKVPEQTTENKMPSEMVVINFIIDNRIKEYYFKKDYNGNTILHSLVIANDIERIEKLYYEFEKFIYEKNNLGETPMDLISGFKVNNFFLKRMSQQIKEQELQISKLKELEQNNSLLTKRMFYVLLLQFIFVLVIFFW
jgi:hypothetical protein